MTKLPHTWHSDKMEEMKGKSIDSLYYIIKDCREAAAAAKDLGNYEAEGRYSDEMHYACMELKKRQLPVNSKKAG